MAEYILDIERYLAHQVETVSTPFSNYNVRYPLYPFNEALSPLLRIKYSKEISANIRNEFIRGTEYFMLDFNDFLEYATSGLTKKFKISTFPDRHIHYYQSIPGTSDFPLFESNYSKFSIMGVCISRGANSLFINMQFRVFISEENPNIIDLIGKNNGIIYEFVNLHLCDHNIEDLPIKSQTRLRRLKLEDIKNGLIIDSEDPDNIVEYTRSHIIPPVQFKTNNDIFQYYNSPDYRIHYSGQAWEEQAESMSEASFKPEAPVDLIKFYREQKEIVKKNHEYNTKILADNFEIARLMVYLPDYFDFMYDLVLNEKKKVSSKKNLIPKYKKKKRVENSANSIYKLIKSIRVSYEAENEARIELNKPKRTWTAPSYKIAVKGHWRIFKNPLWKGRDIEGTEILGRTWVNEYEKGINDENNIHEYHIKDPKVVIKLKQSLSYAKDIIKSHEKRENTSENIKQNISLVNRNENINNETRPSREWMYEERIKLTAGLRYIILKRDNFKCVLCGCGAEDGIKLEIDHIIPISKWGKTEHSNLRAVCRICNQGKGSSTEERGNK